jgi:hypothetical protein
MRENRTYGSEGGATQLNALFLPLSASDIEIFVSAANAPTHPIRNQLLRRFEYRIPRDHR